MFLSNAISNAWKINAPRNKPIQNDKEMNYSEGIPGRMWRWKKIMCAKTQEDAITLMRWAQEKTFRRKSYMFWQVGHFRPNPISLPFRPTIYTKYSTAFNLSADSKAFFPGQMPSIRLRNYSTPLFCLFIEIKCKVICQKHFLEFIRRINFLWPCERNAVLTLHAWKKVRGGNSTILVASRT